MAFLPKSEMTNLTKLSTEKGYFIGRWGEETQIITSASIGILNGVRLLDADGSNYIGLAAPSSVPTDYTISFPSAAPGANTFLKYNGTAYVWAAGGGGGSGDVNNGGNTFGANMSIGTTDAFSLSFIANNTTYATVNTSGAWTFGAAGGTQTHAVNGRLTITSGTSQDAVVVLTPTTSGQGARQYIRLPAAATAGSTYSEWEVSGGVKWSAGFQASVSTFVISQEDGLGTAAKNFFKISTAGLVTLGASGGTQNHLVNGNLNLAAAGEVRFQDTAGGQYAGFKAPGTIASSHTYTLPDALPASSKSLQSNSSGTLSWVDGTRTVGITIDGGGSAITTGVKGYVEVPFTGTITGWTIVGDTSGSIVVDVWKDTYANFPPVVGDSIAGSEKPTISSSTKGQDLSLSTWTTSVMAGDVFGFNVDSCTSITRATLIIRITPA